MSSDIRQGPGDVSTVSGNDFTKLFDSSGTAYSDWNTTFTTDPNTQIWTAYNGQVLHANIGMPSGRSMSASTGVNANETSYALYGHTIPLIALGRGRVGGDIIS